MSKRNNDIPKGKTTIVKEIVETKKIVHKGIMTPEVNQTTHREGMHHSKYQSGINSHGTTMTIRNQDKGNEETKAHKVKEIPFDKRSRRSAKNKDGNKVETIVEKVETKESKGHKKTIDINNDLKKSNLTKTRQIQINIAEGVGPEVKNSRNRIIIDNNEDRGRRSVREKYLESVPNSHIEIRNRRENIKDNLNKSMIINKRNKSKEKENPATTPVQPINKRERKNRTIPIDTKKLNLIEAKKKTSDDKIEQRSGHRTREIIKNKNEEKKEDNNKIRKMSSNNVVGQNIEHKDIKKEIPLENTIKEEKRTVRRREPKTQNNSNQKEKERFQSLRLKNNEKKLKNSISHINVKDNDRYLHLNNTLDNNNLRSKH